MFLCNSVHSQTTIKGVVSDLENKPISYANIVLKDSLGSITSYTYSSENGVYSLSIKETGIFYLSFSSMVSKQKTIIITLKKRKEIVKNVSLQEKSLELDEIIIQTEKTIKVKKDTVEIRINKFLDVNDATVEDLLKKIPGINVDSEGTIKIGNQEIRKTNDRW